MTKPKTALSKTDKAKGLPSEQTVNKIIQRIAAGETLTSICREQGMPPESSVRRRINQSSSLRAAHARAREERAERMADELLDVADDGRNDWMEKEGRNGTITVLNEEAMRRSQLRVDTRKWLLSRLLPQRFGDRVEQAHTGTVQVEHSISAKMLENLAGLRARLPAMSASSPGVVDITPIGESVGTSKRG